MTCFFGQLPPIALILWVLVTIHLAYFNAYLINIKRSSSNALFMATIVYNHASCKPITGDQTILGQIWQNNFACSLLLFDLVYPQMDYKVKYHVLTTEITIIISTYTRLMVHVALKAVLIWSPWIAKNIDNLEAV